MGVNQADTVVRDSGKSQRAFRTISEVSETLDLPQHVLRFWETKFNQIRPLKRGGNRRYYRPEDIELLRTVKSLLYDEGYTIKGVQKRFREQGVRATVDQVLKPQAAAEAPPRPAPEPGREPATPAGLSEILAELKTLRRMLD